MNTNLRTLKIKLATLMNHVANVMKNVEDQGSKNNMAGPDKTEWWIIIVNSSITFYFGRIIFSEDSFKTIIISEISCILFIENKSFVAMSITLRKGYKMTETDHLWGHFTLLAKWELNRTEVNWKWAALKNWIKLDGPKVKWSAVRDQKGKNWAFFLI